ncbi:hypothetical protein [Schleiferilactobacillus harbinensis]|uniref:hypothetical protein n=1 Tax=Schleiferilactobacillus harbinensis TaxID=304207 RepID=UPI001FB9FA10|nr:hypothetical protein [Schleiferilactobacillus harbinensis]
MKKNRFRIKYVGAVAAALLAAAPIAATAVSAVSAPAFAATTAKADAQPSRDELADAVKQGQELIGKLDNDITAPRRLRTTPLRLVLMRRLLFRLLNRILQIRRMLQVRLRLIKLARLQSNNRSLRLLSSHKKLLKAGSIASKELLMLPSRTWQLQRQPLLLPTKQLKTLMARFKQLVIRLLPARQNKRHFKSIMMI